MHNKQWALLCLFLTILINHASAQEPLSLAFLQPDGEGSPEEAQPLMDALAQQLSAQTHLTIVARYENRKPNIKQSIQSQKEDLLLLSTDLYFDHQNDPFYEVALSTLPLATTGSFNQYYLVADSKLSEPPQQILLSRPLPDSFLQHFVVGSCTQLTELNPQWQPTEQIFQALKTISAQKSQWILLDDFQFQALNQLNMSWAKTIIKKCESSPIPSAPLLFKKNLKDSTKDSLTTGFLRLSETAQGKEILESLRLKGFTKPTTYSIN